MALLGDVNGDGFADLAVGAPDADPLGRENAGEVYIVFGRADGFPASLDPGTLDGTEGLVVQGPNPGAFAGFAVAGAGDVNGDGFDDLLIGAYGTLDGGPAGAGGAWVVFGGDDLPARLDLAALTADRGIALPGVVAGSDTGRSVAAAGDVNGDGFDDVLVGARYTDLAAGGEGVAYLVFGRDDDPGVIDLATLDVDHAGCTLRGTGPDVYAGFALAGPGDIDGDGFADVVVGAPAPPGGADPGTVYVVYGGEEPAAPPAPAPAPTPAPLLMADAFTYGDAPSGDTDGVTPASWPTDPWSDVAGAAMGTQGETEAALAGASAPGLAAAPPDAPGDGPPGPVAAAAPPAGEQADALRVFGETLLHVLNLALPFADPVGAWDRLFGGADDRGESFWG
ncbi:hypothetical protein HRbin39_01404 [bacterium HR39]|nr:hypothetical protein HRbin39_01404 [bacterium HR39]